MFNGGKAIKSKDFNIKSSPERKSFYKLACSVKRRFKRKYSKETSNQHNLNILEDLIFNKKTHLVAVFKDHMIADYIDEFLKREYSLKEANERLPKFAVYYLNYLSFFGLPTFSDLIPNDIIKEYGEKRAEAYYNKNYRHGKEDESFSLIEDEDDNNISRSRAMRTIFNSRIKDTIDNVTMFTVKHSESNTVSLSNAVISKRKKKKAVNSLDSKNDDTIALQFNGTISSCDHTELVSKEASLVSYVKMFSRHQNHQADKIKSKIKVKRLGNYAPPNGLSKRRKVNIDKESDVGSGTIDNSNNFPHNLSLTKFKGLLSLTNLFLNKKEQTSKLPLFNGNSNKSNGSNGSTLKVSNISKENGGVKKNKSRNAPQCEIGFKLENIPQVNDQRLQLTKTQIDNLISKYTIYNNPKLLSSMKKKQSVPCSQLKMTLKAHPLVVSQSNQNGYVKSNPNFWKRKSTSVSTNKKEQGDSNVNKHHKKQNTEDLMKIALSLLMESKKAKSAANVNININNQININTNFPVKGHIDNRLSRNDNVALNIKSNLNNLLQSNKYSRNKERGNGLGSNTDEDGTIASSAKCKLFTSWNVDDKRQPLFKAKHPPYKFTSNNFNRPPSNDYSLKKSKGQPPQIKPYFSKDSSSKPRPKISFTSSNCLFQTISKPCMVATANTKSTSSFKKK